MKEIEETEGEGSAGARPGGRKPSGVEKLSAAIAIVVVFTKAVEDTHGMHTSDVEQRETDGIRGEGTQVASAVTKLVGKAQVEESRFRKESAVPLLKVES